MAQRSRFFFMPRQQAVCLKHTFLLFTFFFLRLQRRKLGRYKRYRMSGNSRWATIMSQRTGTCPNPRPTCVLDDVLYLQAEIYKEDFMKEQQEKERLLTRNQMMEENFRKMSSMPQVCVKLGCSFYFLLQAKQKVRLKSVSGPSSFLRDTHWTFAKTEK